MIGKTLVVGLGSAHGDDQIGWCVAGSLAASIAGSTSGPLSTACDSLTLSDDAIAFGADTPAWIRVARSPSELLDWLDALDRLIVCDACQDIGAPGNSLRLCWPDRRLATLRCSGSHDMGLVDMLALAERLGRLPKAVIIWCVQAEATVPGSSLSASGRMAMRGVAEQIWEELGLRFGGPNRGADDSTAKSSWSNSCTSIR
ncbi:MAG TPA: hypothetical protein VHC22_13725 [Pirellulales bacterium]|nr:hypothetical protein [Pirellulales bacterium]